MLQLQTLCQNEKLWYYWYTRKLLRTFFRVRRIDQTNLKKLGLLFVGFSSFLKLFLCVYYGHLMTNGIETDNCRKTFLYSFLQKEKLNQFVNYCAQLLQNWNSKLENHTLNHIMFQLSFSELTQYVIHEEQSTAWTSPWENICCFSSFSSSMILMYFKFQTLRWTSFGRKLRWISQRKIIVVLYATKCSLSLVLKVCIVTVKKHNF